MTHMLAVKAVVARELTKVFRQRARLLSAMVRPMIWLLVIGSGVGSMLQGEQQAGYLSFLVPGIVAMTLLFACLFHMASIGISDASSSAALPNLHKNKKKNYNYFL